ncbi:MAG TPA: biotin/lipoyl-containing protein, partial [Xanthobacteraceae bacterium]|nr:biotin/lipoyl-containing protein [Xanthobacteraceae bacterium]
DGSEGLRADAVWFIEMNTRLQVEHPVTEAITGVDLVEWQLRIAAGEKLPRTQGQIRLDGHAVEARVYAEDPEHDFLPSTGTIVALELPSDIRIDTGVEAGGQVTPYYDPMIAKLIAQAPTRQAALDRLSHALDRTVIAGVRSNIAFLANLCRADEFRRGAVDTGLIDRNLPRLGAVPQPRDNGAAALGVAHLLNAAAANEAQSVDDSAPSESPWDSGDGFQLGGVRSTSIPIVIDGENADATLTYAKDGAQVAVDGADPATDAKVFAAGHDAYVVRGGRQTRIQIRDFAVPSASASAGDGVIKAPMHGKVLEVLAAVGDRVAFGQRLAVIEAMKMEHTLRAPFTGIVTQVPVRTGAQVVESAPVMVLEPIPESPDDIK